MGYRSEHSLIKNSNQNSQVDDEIIIADKLSREIMIVSPAFIIVVSVADNVSREIIIFANKVSRKSGLL